jgi:hypothetical protein
MIANLRPRGVGEVLDAAVALYKARFVQLVKLTTIVVVPVQLLNVLITLSTRPSDITIGTTGAQPVYDGDEAVWVPLAGTIVMQVVVVLSTAFATAAVTRLVADTYLDQPTSAGGSTRLALHRLPAVLALSIVTSLLVIAGTFACVVPGIWLQVSWAVAMPALLLEEKGVRAAMSRSFALTKFRWGQCFAVYYVGSLLSSFVALGLTAVLDGAISVAVEGTAALAIAQGVSGAITAALTTPFIAAAVVVLYFDLRVRGEGFDIQMALHDMDHARLRAAPFAAG